jgi:hypothetical protein
MSQLKGSSALQQATEKFNSVIVRFTMPVVLSLMGKSKRTFHGRKELEDLCKKSNSLERSNPSLEKEVL